MKLTSVHVEGYRRFRTRQRLQLDTRLVALLGPNEAGKTSVLRLLQRLNDDRAFVTQGAAQDMSRGNHYPPGHVVITAKFLIEDTDRGALKDIKEAENIRWLMVNKPVSGKREFKTIPTICRDRSLRSSVLASIRKLTSPDFRSADANVKPLPNTINERANQVANGIDDPDVETVSPGVMAMFDGLAEALAKADDAPELSETRAQVMALIEHERKEHPAQMVEKILAPRVPRFVFFSEHDRGLETNYDLTPFFGNKPPPLPLALDHLVRTAKLDFAALREAVNIGDAGAIDSTFENANEVLKEKMNASWNQSKCMSVFD